MTSPPLDAAAHVAVVKRTLANVQDRAQVDPILDEVLRLAGIADIEALIARQQQGLSVYGVIEPYPIGSQAELAAAIAALRTLAIAPVSVPAGRPIVPGEGWSIPEAEISIEALKTLELEDLHYESPLF